MIISGAASIDSLDILQPASLHPEKIAEVRTLSSILQSIPYFSNFVCKVAYAFGVFFSFHLLESESSGAHRWKKSFNCWRTPLGQGSLKMT